jgi:hypothetical protein
MVGFLSLLYVWRIWENVKWVCEKCKVSVLGASNDSPAVQSIAHALHKAK